MVDAATPASAARTVAGSARPSRRAINTRARVLSPMAAATVAMSASPAGVVCTVVTASGYGPDTSVATEACGGLSWRPAARRDPPGSGAPYPPWPGTRTVGFLTVVRSRMYERAIGATLDHLAGAEAPGPLTS